MMIFTRDGGSLLLDFKSDDTGLHQTLIKIMKARHLIKLVQQANDSEHNRSYSIQIFDCFIQIIQEEKLTILSAIYNPTMMERKKHLLIFWMKHMCNQMESEFTPKLFKCDVPSYEITDPKRFRYYQEIFSAYSELQLNKITSSFGSYVQKLLQEVLAQSKARYLLSRLIIIECSTSDIILDHSFVKDSGRNVNFYSSKNFVEFMDQFEILRQKQTKKGIIQNSRRRSVMSNYNNRTYNKETLQQLSFGAFIVSTSTFKTPLEQEYKISLIFEKNLKRKQMLEKKAFLRFSHKLNRRYEEQNIRNDKYFQSIDFFRFLFDFSRSNPFSQFTDRDQLNQIKNQIRLMMLQAQTPLSKRKKGGLIQRRKFGSEMTMMTMNPIKLNSSLVGVNEHQISKDGEQTNFAKTRASGKAGSSSSGLNFNNQKTDLFKATPEQNSPNTSESSSSSSSSSDEEDESNNDLDQNPSSNVLFEFLQQQHSFQTALQNQNSGIQNITKDFQSIRGRKSVFFGVSMRGFLSDHDESSNMQSQNLSMDDPVQNEIQFQQDLNEYKHSLYDMANDTIITISSIQEFDKEKDWLSKQIAYDSSDQSDGNRTIKDLASNIQVGVPSPGLLKVQTGEGIQKQKRPSFRIQENSSAILHQARNQKRPSIMITVMPDTSLSQLQAPRRKSMKVVQVNGLSGFNNQINFEISPSTTSKRPSLMLLDNFHHDMNSNESPMPFSKFQGIQENVKEEEEEEIEDLIQQENDLINRQISNNNKMLIINTIKEESQ
ncbi:UNKNOWN [Stylonychia lemnae]|uniref:Uncharacterized protein n=1 Tax=Stylonychia lemnae TaxID=5949 RepID=A0A078A7Z4_STYLE|nr:UNKNOWN [Stylonychia lemnae]|eukprot:CDW77981.1 UNKNOWN [Stylonychia lemnae]